MRALVTGATGFIGSVLVRELLLKQHEVKALALPGEDTSRLESAGVSVLRGDLTDRESIRGLCDGADTVFHLAARVTDWAQNRNFTARFSTRPQTSSKSLSAARSALSTSAQSPRSDWART
jgi:dihydroflavonol-4-reductase